eukprot:1308050-Amphidinium_carterae.1
MDGSHPLKNLCLESQPALSAPTSPRPHGQRARFPICTPVLFNFGTFFKPCLPVLVWNFNNFLLRTNTVALNRWEGYSSYLGSSMWVAVPALRVWPPRKERPWWVSH